MTRTLSEDMREEREDLKEAAEQTLNIIVDLDLEGRIKWVSPSWRQVVGSPPESVEGRMISEILVGNKSVFRDAIEAMKEDDSRSRFIRFSVRMGPDSVLKYAPEPRPIESENDTEREGKITEEKSTETEPSQAGGEDNHDVLTMEGQGIMVYDQTDDEAGHVSPISHNDLNVESDALLTTILLLTVHVDAPTAHRIPRSDHRSATSARRVTWCWRRSPGELPD